MEEIKPFFSIVIPSFNRGSFLTETIRSIQSQSFVNWECILVDDGSTDNTFKVVNSILEKDERIRYIYQENSERCVARNNGIGHAKGKYICFLDSDDLFLSDHLEILENEILKMNKPEALFFTNAFDNNDKMQISERNCPDIEISSIQDYILKYTFNPARVAVSASILKNFKFDIQIPGLEDLELWLRISFHYPIYQIKKRTIIYNLHENSYTIGDLKRYEKELKFFKYIFEKSEFRDRLSRKSKNRLLSMCLFHLSIKALSENKRFKFYTFALKSFIYYPRGYNGKTNKILFVSSIYTFPLVGFIIRKLIKFSRK